MVETLNEITQELEWRRCKKDPYYAIENYWKISHPEQGAILLRLRDAQRSVLSDWLEYRMTIALKARQVGFSSLAMALAWWETFFHPDHYEIALSRKEEEAWALVEKYKYGYERLPQWMRDRGPKKLEYSKGKIVWDNGSKLHSMPSNDPARGSTGYRIFVDEWAFFPDPGSAWSAIEPASDIGGRIVALSTANGSGNLFHDMFVRAQTGSNKFHPIFHSWRAVPERNDQWYEDKKSNMQVWQLHQEYPTTPEEAFIMSGNPVFNIEELYAMETRPPLAVGYLDPIDSRASSFESSEGGPLQIWEHPDRSHKYCIGADVAEGLEHGDYSVAWVLDTTTGNCVAKWRGHIDADLFGSHVLHYLGWYYGAAYLGVEANNHGGMTLVALRNAEYPHLYYNKRYDERTLKHTEKMGWLTNIKTKPLVIDALQRDLRLDKQNLFLPDAETIGELKTYTRDEAGKMSGSPFDDQVMALAIANQMRQHVFTTKWVNAEPARMTIDWWLNQFEDEGPPGPLVIGRHKQQKAKKSMLMMKDHLEWVK